MEDLTRRTVIRGAAAVVVAVPLAGLLPEDLAYAAGPALSRSTFTPRKGTVFSAANRGVTKLRLTAIEDLDKRSPGHQHRFSLSFTVLSGRRLPSGTYRFNHPKIGTFSMFVNPVGLHSDLQAVFNQR